MRISDGVQTCALPISVFYPTGGGQPGDCGDLVLPDGARLRVVDAVKGDGHEDVVHLLEEGAAPPAPGTRVTAEIDWDRRHRHMRMHTCLHLPCAVVTGDVTGGQIGPAKGRLDLNLPHHQPSREPTPPEPNPLPPHDPPTG